VCDALTLYRTPATNEGRLAASTVKFPAPVLVWVTVLTLPSARLSKVSVTAVLIGNVPKLTDVRHRFIRSVSAQPPQL
jgi:hypothetical protein